MMALITTQRIVMPKFKRATLPQLDLAEPHLTQIAFPRRQNAIDELHASGGVLEHLGIQVQFMPTIRSFAMHPHIDVVPQPREPLLQVLSERYSRLLAAAKCLSTFVRS